MRTFFIVFGNLMVISLTALLVWIVWKIHNES